MGRFALTTPFTWVLALILFRPVAAEEDSGAAVELRQVVITGTRTEKPKLEAPIHTRSSGSQGNQAHRDCQGRYLGALRQQYHRGVINVINVITRRLVIE